MWWMIAVLALSSPIVLLMFGRRNEAAIKRDWELLLTPKGERVYRAIEGRVQSERALAEITFDQAFTVRELGSVNEAIRLLDVGYRVIERFSPNMLRLLSAMAAYSRMVSAMAPIGALKPTNFRISQLVSLAYLNGFLHRFLVSTGERFRLRVYILGRSFAIASRFLLESTERIVTRQPEAEREWKQIQAIREDFDTLTEESLATLRVLLQSLSAERRDTVLRFP